MRTKFLAASFVLLCAAVLIAQDAPSGNSTPPPPPRRGGMSPCLRVAGVSMSEFDQLRSIAQDARTQVKDVCTNTSLTPQQKQQQIEGIHQQSHEKMTALVSPDQRRSFMACRARHGDRRSVEWFERPGGGCGEMQRAGHPNRGASGNASDPAESESPSENGPPSRNAPPQNESAPQKNDSSPQ